MMFIYFLFILGYIVSLEAISKMQITFKDKARTDPPSLKKLWRDRRKSGVPPAMSSTF
jgi:hypothetical protein